MYYIQCLKVRLPSMDFTMHMIIFIRFTYSYLYKCTFSNVLVEGYGCTMHLKEYVTRCTFTVGIPHQMYIYSTFTVCLQQVYSTFTVHLQYVYSTFTVCLQYVYSITHRTGKLTVCPSQRSLCPVSPGNKITVQYST